MAAYAALVSLMSTVEQILNHPRHSICFDKKQIESLQEKVGFFLDFIKSYNSHANSKEVEDFESQIASAAHAAEDVIETRIVDQILAGSTGDRVETSSNFFLELLKRINDIQKRVRAKIQSTTVKFRLLLVMKDMNSIKKKIMKMEKKGRFNDQHLTYSTSAAASSTPLTTGKTTMVGFDSYLIQLQERLAGQQSDLQIIPIVGMGGIGKTTLARNAFENSLIVEHFDVRAWVTVSQSYSVREILLKLLSSHKNSESFTALEAHELGEGLRKHLYGRRYIIILDDIWGIEVWDNIKRYFPDEKNGSRIVVTTRLTAVSIHFDSSYLAINFLDEDQSWKLFCETVFGKEDCPTELEEAGKKIAKNCRGLPLSIVVIGGFLRKSFESQEYWEKVAKDTNSILNSEGEEQCMNMLSLSYSHLPAHLKPCFLYMGVFPEDDEIRVSQLIKLWIAEGFLKQNEAPSLEEVAEGYIRDLVDRNLISVGTWGSNGKIKACNIHDLLRALCLRVAKKEKFLCVMKLLDTPRTINRERRIVIDESIPMQEHALESAALARSLICKGHRSFNFRLLRTFINTVDKKFDRGFLEADFQYVNLRCLDRQAVEFQYGGRYSSEHLTSLYQIPRKISLFWNLQTLRMKGCTARIVAPSEIWKMPQLMHIDIDTLCLPDPPPSDTKDQKVDFVLQNLQTLSRAENFRLSEEVSERIPNIKKLRILYCAFPEEYRADSYYCPHNLSRFHNLESLNFHFSYSLYWQRHFLLNITFPNSLKKLSLYQSMLYWEDLSMIGLLPLLEVLKLECHSVIGRKWNLDDDVEFRQLKFLKIHACSDLTTWNANESHFPVLQNLVLGYLNGLGEIPSGIGDIPALKCIRLNNCRLSCAVSAMKILQDQQEIFGNEGPQLEVQFHIVNTKNLEEFKKMVEEKGPKIRNKIHVKSGLW